jgi:hypothetical protein
MDVSIDRQVHSDRITEAFLELQQIEFEFTAGFRWCFRRAASCFNRATLWRVFGLAQILQKEQPITVRGAFYRAVSAGLFPDTGDSHYTCCGRLILLMRREGFIPYGYIVDSTRRRLKFSSWSGLADFAETVAHAYRKDFWSRQPEYLEIFVEKDAMAAVIEPITREFDIYLNVIRGQVSETFVYDISEVWKEIQKPIIAYYLGDHDPAGLKIEENLRRSLVRFGVEPTMWERLAVTAEDFRDERFLGFPVKKSNNASGFWRPYVREFGDRCVEVDAIPATEIRGRIKEAILAYVDQCEWKFLQAQEAREKEAIWTRFGLGQIGLTNENGNGNPTQS